MLYARLLFLVSLSKLQFNFHSDTWCHLLVQDSSAVWQFFIYFFYLLWERNLWLVIYMHVFSVTSYVHCITCIYWHWNDILFLIAERNVGELEGDLWEDVEFEMHEEVMDTIPQISDDQSDTLSSQLQELQSEDLEPKSMELSITAVFLPLKLNQYF